MPRTRKKAGSDNRALLHDELLVEVALVVDEGRPAGPGFLHAFGSLAEAVVLHDTVYFDAPCATRESERGFIGNVLTESAFIQALQRDGALTPSPAQQDVDAELELRGSSYRWINFYNDHFWRSWSFLNTDPGKEGNDYRNLIDLVTYLPSIFASSNFFGISTALGATLDSGGLNALAATALGFNYNDMLVIEGLNHRAAAFLDLAEHLELELYPYYAALPYQLGAIGARNSQVRRIYDMIVSEVEKDDVTDAGRIGQTAFSRIRIPPLAQIAMRAAAGSPAALATELLALRERHRKFRDYLADFQRAWTLAETRQQRQALKNEFAGAWTTLLSTNATPRPAAFTRILGFIWSLVRGGAQMGLPGPATVIGSATAVGDAVVAKGTQRSIVRRARGLHDFYKELANSPVADRNRRLVNDLFPAVVEDDTWALASGLATGIDERFVRKDPSQLLAT